MAIDIYVPNHENYCKTTSAILTSSAKLVARVFAITLARWTSTVLTLMPSSWAMVLFCCPLSKPASTSSSLLLKVANFSLSSFVFRRQAQVRLLPAPANAARTVSSRASPSNGFSKKWHRSLFHCGDCQWNIAMRGDDDNRHRDAALFHFCQQIESRSFPAYARPSPGNRNRLVGSYRGMFARISTCANRITFRRQQEGQCGENRLIIVNNVYC